ncbi:unnamed protein product [Symbiodinium sp. CCMP2456]|nr:unnamed protein product [Symbiodinium sp. CCMP2456]
MDRSWNRSANSTTTGEPGDDDPEDDNQEASNRRRESVASDSTWSYSDWSRSTSWYSGGWHQWQGSWNPWPNAGPSVTPELPELMPEFVQGWLLLQDCNLDAGERNLVITAAGGDFSLNRIIKELRAQFPDADLKRRDTSRKHHGFLGAIPEEDEDDYEDAPAEMSFIAEEELNDEGMALWAAARGLRRGRRGARSDASGSENIAGGGGRRDDSQIICMSCGKKGHRKANCPDEVGTHTRKEPESAPFLCYAGDPEPADRIESAMGTSLPTAAAVAQGKCVVDCGATRSIGSIKALEQLMSRNVAKTGSPGVNQVDLHDKPTFNFGNSSENQCASTVEMKLQAGSREGRLRIHALDMGQGPILLSIAALRALGAIVDFEEDVMVLRNVDCHRLIELERSASGHQLLDLSSNLFEKSQPTVQAVKGEGPQSRSGTGLDVSQNSIQHRREPRQLDMSSMTNAQLRARIAEYGEQAPSRWTKAELLLRLEELTGQNTFSPAPKNRAEKTEYQRLVQDLNGASNRRAELVSFCRNNLRLSVDENMTMNALKRLAMLHIYQTSRPDPTDTVGFGKHSTATYEEIKVRYTEYARWVVTTAKEFAEADPRLLRLAEWLENNPAQVIHRKDKKSSRSEASSSGYASGADSASSSKIEVLANVVDKLREEIADLKKDREPRRKVKTVETDSEMSEGSFAMIPTGKGGSKTQGPKN